MGFLLKRAFLIGFLPGFLFLTGVIVVCKDYNIEGLCAFGNKLSVPLGIGIVIISFIIGQIFDSIRYCFIEGWRYKHFKKQHKKRRLRYRKDVNWDFFYDAPKEKIEKLDDNYYIWYDLNVDLVVSLVGLVIFVLVHALFGKVNIIPDAVVIGISILKWGHIQYCSARLLLFLPLKKLEILLFLLASSEIFCYIVVRGAEPHPSGTTNHLSGLRACSLSCSSILGTGKDLYLQRAMSSLELASTQRCLKGHGLQRTASSFGAKRSYHPPSQKD